MIHGIHLTLCWLAAVAGLAVIVIGLVERRPGRLHRRFLDRAILVAILSVIAASALGLVLYVESGGPADSLHFLYAGVALAVLPVARFSGGLRAAPRTSFIVLGGLVFLGVVVRLGQTG